MAKKNIHVSRTKGGGWKVTQDGKAMSGHRTQRDAIDAGRREAAKARVELITHERDGKIRPEDSYVVAYRIIKESAGTPSVSRAKISAAARDVIRAAGGWAVKSATSNAHRATGQSPKSKRTQAHASGKSAPRVSSKRRIS